MNKETAQEMSEILQQSLSSLTEKTITKEHLRIQICYPRNRVIDVELIKNKKRSPNKGRIRLRKSKG